MKMLRSAIFAIGCSFGSSLGAMNALLEALRQSVPQMAPQEITEELCKAIKKGGFASLDALASYMDNPQCDLALLDSTGNSPLHYAAAAGGVMAIAIMQKAQQRHILDRLIQITNPSGMLPLHCAVMGGDLKVVKALVEAGEALPVGFFGGRFNLNALQVRENKDFGTMCFGNPLHMACFLGATDIVEYLISKGALLDVQDGTHGRTGVHAAICGGHFELLKKILPLKPSLNIPDNQGRLPLHEAARSGHAGILKAVLFEDVSCINAQDSSGATPLFYAITQGHLSCVRLLLDQGARRNIRVRGNDLLPLHLACHMGHADVAQLLIEQEEDKTALNDEDQTLLHAAVLGGHARMVRKLIDWGFDWLVKDGTGKTPLDYARSHSPTLEKIFLGAELRRAAQKGDMAKVTALLAQPGIDLLEVDGVGNTALHVAAAAGRENVLVVLLDYAERNAIRASSVSTQVSSEEIAWGAGATVQRLVETHHGEIPPQIATLASFVARAYEPDKEKRDETISSALSNVFSLFLEPDTERKKRDDLGTRAINYIDVTNKHSATALHAAIAEGHLPCVRLLLDRGANFEICAHRNQDFGFAYSGRPLHVACLKGNKDIAQLLIARGADIRALDGSKRSTLHAASIGGCQELVKDFLEKDLPVVFQDAHGKTPPQYAHENGHYSLAAFFLMHAGGVNNYNDAGLCPIHFAAMADDCSLARHLKREGAVLHPTDEKGWQPIHYAAHLGSCKMLDWCIDHVPYLPGGLDSILCVAARAGQRKAMDLIIRRAHEIQPDPIVITDEKALTKVGKIRGLNTGLGLEYVNARGLTTSTGIAAGDVRMFSSLDDIEDNSVITFAHGKTGHVTTITKDELVQKFQAIPAGPTNLHLLKLDVRGDKPPFMVRLSFHKDLSRLTHDDCALLKNKALDGFLIMLPSGTAEWGDRKLSYLLWALEERLPLCVDALIDGGVPATDECTLVRDLWKQLAIKQKVLTQDYPELVTPVGATPLHLAAEAEHDELCSLIIQSLIAHTLVQDSEENYKRVADFFTAKAIEEHTEKEDALRKRNLKARKEGFSEQVVPPAPEFAWSKFLEQGLGEIQVTPELVWQIASASCWLDIKDQKELMTTDVITLVRKNLATLRGLFSGKPVDLQAVLAQNVLPKVKALLSVRSAQGIYKHLSPAESFLIKVPDIQKRVDDETTHAQEAGQKAQEAETNAAKARTEAWNQRWSVGNRELARKYEAQASQYDAQEREWKDKMKAHNKQAALYQEHIAHAHERARRFDDNNAQALVSTIISEWLLS